jgi:hypothetical protein
MELAEKRTCPVKSWCLFFYVITVKVFLKSAILIAVCRHEIENSFNVATIVREFVNIVIAYHGAVII